MGQMLSRTHGHAAAKKVTDEQAHLLTDEQLEEEIRRRKYGALLELEEGAVPSDHVERICL